MFEECKEFFEARIGETYGTYSQIDHMDFVLYLKDNDLSAEDYDLEGLIDEWIQQDRVYKDYLN